MRMIWLSLATFLFCIRIAPCSAAEVTIEESIRQALQYSPRLQTLQYNRDALEHELRQARGGYYPSVDLSLGYGAEQTSDVITRSPGADPADDDWDGRSEARLLLSQVLFDGGEVAGLVGVQQAKVKSGEMRVLDNGESIALDAVIAHLEVYRQQELLDLAEKNIADHLGIIESLEKRQKGGVGSVADVNQAYGRLTRARATLENTKASLISAQANYFRVVGKLPSSVNLAPMPGATPKTLEEAFDLTRRANPKVLALAANLEEAEATQKLARANYFPKINLELSSNYLDRVEGDETWEFSNAAMVRLRWNLYNGGSDAAGRQSAFSRKLEAVAERDDQLIRVLEQTQTTWAEMQAAMARVKAFNDAVAFNEKTLDAYLKQFNVAQRSLLNVLDAENELFQSSGLLVTAQVNEIIAAYRLLALGGTLQQSVLK